jgi:membrane protein YdbS with pleckstrin-like domain
MQEFEHIQSLWDRHKVEVKISSEEMLAQVKKDVNGIKTKSLLNISGMVLSFIAIASIWLFYDVQSWTTHAGLTIIISSVAVYTFILYKSHRLIAQNDFTLHPKAFLNSLKQYQLNRFSLYNKLYWIYTIALSVGLGLYFFETLARFDLWMQCLVIILTFGWILFCSALVRKVAMRRERERIALLIEKFERLSTQFKEQE